MDLKQQRYFVALAEDLHFGKAAAKLGISQPALSKQIRDLEGELGVELVWRKDGVRLTPAGAALLQHAREILGLVDRSLRAVRGIGKGDLGSLEIGFMSSAGARIVPRIVRAFRKSHPRVEVRLRLLVPPTALDLVRSSQVDFAFVVPLDRSEGLTCEPVLREPYILALPTGHPLTRQAEVPIRALDQARFVFYPRHVAPDLFDQITGYLRTHGAVPNIVLEAFPVQAMMAAVAAGIGVTLLPESMRDVRQKGIVYRSLRKPRPTLSWVIAYRQGPLGAAQRAFLQVVRKVWGAHRKS